MADFIRLINKLAIIVNQIHYLEWYTWNPKTRTKGELKDIELYDRENDSNETILIIGEQSLGNVIEALSEKLAGGCKKSQPGLF